MILQNLRFAHFIQNRQYVYPSKIIKKRGHVPNWHLFEIGVKGL